MSAGQAPPPWLQDEMIKMQESQQHLQMLAGQKQHLDAENVDITRAIDELEKVSDDHTVFKQTGTVMIKAQKQKLIEELKEQAILAKTRMTLLQKQEAQLNDTLKTQQEKITGLMQGDMKKNQPTNENPRK